MCQKYEKCQIRQWLGEYKDSGLGIYEFCKGKPFHASELFHWLEVYNCIDGVVQSAIVDEPNDFIEVEGPWPVGTSLITVSYPNGVRLDINFAMDCEQLKILVQ